MTSMVTGTFETRVAAEEALRRLEAIGITEDHISVVATDECAGKTFNIDTHTRADEGFAGGATAGGIIGAILGAVASAGVIVIPGVNLVVTGALVGGLAGLATGATAGGLLGGLIGAGIPEHEAKLYEKDIHKGHVLLAVHPENDEQHDKAKEIFEESDAYNMAA